MVPGIMARLAAAMNDVYVKKGTTIYRQGDPSEHFHFLVTGEVRLEAPGQPSFVLGDESVIGIIDVMADRPRTRTAVATRDAHLLRLRGEDWLDMLEDNFEVARNTVIGVSMRVHDLVLQLAPSGGFQHPIEGASAGGKLSLVEKILALREIAYFSRAGIQALASVAGLLEEVRFEPGAVLFEASDAVAPFIFIVVSGTVGVKRAQPQIAASFGPGTIVAGHTAFTPEIHAYHAEALTRAVALRVRREDLFDRMEEHFDLARSVIVSAGLEMERLRLLAVNHAEARAPRGSG
jgi:CRP-like cAMP-binding protein